MKFETDLRQAISALDHRGYPGYKGLRGMWKFRQFVLVIDHVQGDPFASPSSLHIEVDGKTAGFPEEMYSEIWRRRALEDFLIRAFADSARRYSFKVKGSGKSGLIESSVPGQEVLSRTACEMNAANGSLIFRFKAGFPANGRSIAGQALIRMLTEYVPKIVSESLLLSGLDGRRLKEAIDLADDQHAVREKLDELGLISFLADGSVLPRESGVSARPMKNAVPLRSPDSLAVMVELPHRGKVRGMGIRKGISLVVGGGYHGKSTLLGAIMLGVYDHIGGDGRELVITNPTAMKIRAEDGRSIAGVDISLFINNLPNGTDSRQFYSENASGSTSQAANTMEAIEAGCGLLLIDEDTSATNFMMRDELMKAVIPDEEEPITPFIDRIECLCRRMGISTILVAGSFGAYFEKADTILQMDHYEVKDITARAKVACRQFLAENEITAPECSVSMPHRVPVTSPAFFGRNERMKLRGMGLEGFSIEHEKVDLRYVEQLVDPEQTEALAICLRYLEQNLFDGNRPLAEAVAKLENMIDSQGLAALTAGSQGVPLIARPRREEMFAAVNRYRKLKLKGNH